MRIMWFSLLLYVLYCSSQDMGQVAFHYHSGGGRPPYIKLKLIMCGFQKYMMEML